MKRCLFICFALVFISVNAQNFESLVFVNGCSNQIVEPQYDVCTETVFLLRVQYILDGVDSVAYGSSIVDIRKPIRDTIVMSNFLFSVDKKSKKGRFLNCGEPLQGLFSVYFQNGNKRFEGDFSNGNPTEIKSFRYDGTLDTHKYFVPGTIKASRINYFGKDGKVIKYETFKQKKRKTIIKTYDGANKIIARKKLKDSGLVHFNILNPNNVATSLSMHRSVNVPIDY